MGGEKNYGAPSRSNVTLFSKGFRLKPSQYLHPLPQFKRNPVLEGI